MIFLGRHFFQRKLCGVVLYDREILYVHVIRTHDGYDDIDTAKIYKGSVMRFKPMRTKREYQQSIKQAEALMGGKSGSRQAGDLEVLSLLIQVYESEHYLMQPVDPVDLLLHVMEARGLERKDLEPYIGSRRRVAEILNRIRPMSLNMIRRFSDGLAVSAELLISQYPLRAVHKVADEVPLA